MKYVKAFGNWLLIAFTIAVISGAGYFSWVEHDKKTQPAEKLWWVEPIITPIKYCATITVQCSEGYAPFRNELPCLTSEIARDSAIESAVKIILETDCKILAVDLYER